jgi:hypothetical protein
VNVGNGLVDSKQPPYILPHELMPSQHIVGTFVRVGTWVMVAMLVIGVVVSVSEQDGAVKLGYGLVDSKQPPYVCPQRST